jgi:hypothetical protein
MAHAHYLSGSVGAGMADLFQQALNESATVTLLLRGTADPLILLGVESANVYDDGMVVVTTDGTVVVPFTAISLMRIESKT